MDANPSSKTNFFKLRVLHKSGLDEFRVSSYGLVFNHLEFQPSILHPGHVDPKFFSTLPDPDSKKILGSDDGSLDFMSENNVQFDLRKWMFCFVNDVLLDFLLEGKVTLRIITIRI